MDDIQPEERCVAHDARKYSAHLANLLPGIDAVEACKATPFTIHGVTHDNPDYCENVSPSDLVSNLRIFHNEYQRFFSGIHGHWTIKDPVCSTFWFPFYDKVS
jgi:hypothetical protein